MTWSRTVILLLEVSAFICLFLLRQMGFWQTWLNNWGNMLQHPKSSLRVAGTACTISAITKLTFFSLAFCSFSAFLLSRSSCFAQNFSWNKLSENEIWAWRKYKIKSMMRFTNTQPVFCLIVMLCISLFWSKGWRYHRGFYIGLTVHLCARFVPQLDDVRWRVIRKFCENSGIFFQIWVMFLLLFDADLDRCHRDDNSRRIYLPILCIMKLKLCKCSDFSYVN